MTASGTVRIALDILGGDGSADIVVAGALAARTADPTLEITLVGPQKLADAALAALGAPSERFPVSPASQVVEMDEDPARAVRSKRDASIRVATRLVRDGAADAVVSIGSSGAALAAGVFTLGRLPGVTRPGLAVVIPATQGPVVLLDVGATTDATPDQLVQLALSGAALSRVALGIEHPRIGLLSIGHEPGKGDELRRNAWALLDGLTGFIGNVEGSDISTGAAADVIVTDGFTGNIVLKAMEGTVGALAQLGPLPSAANSWAPDLAGGGVLLGVAGVVVVGHGSATSTSVAACLAQAAGAVREGLVPRLGEVMHELVEHRRSHAGFTGRSA